MKKLWKIILFIIILVIAFFFPVIVAYIGSALASFLGVALPVGFAASIPWWVGAVVGVGLAYLVDPDTTQEIIDDLAGIAKEIATEVVEVGGAVVGSLLNNPWVLAAGAAALYYFFGRKKQDDVTVVLDGGQA